MIATRATLPDLNTLDRDVLQSILATHERFIAQHEELIATQNQLLVKEEQSSVTEFLVLEPLLHLAGADTREDVFTPSRHDPMIVGG